MNTADILSLISTICYILAGVSLVLAVFFWFFFKIPTVIGDLSGRTARKSIAKMRSANERSGYKSYRSSSTNMQRGKVTDTMRLGKAQTAEPQKPASQKLVKTTKNERLETGLLEENKVQPEDSQETELLVGNQPAPVAAPASIGSEETELLVNNQPAPAPVAAPASIGSEETELLVNNQPVPAPVAAPASIGSEETELLVNNQPVPAPVAAPASIGSEETELLVNNQPAPVVIPEGSEETMPLDSNETELLGELPTINPGTKHLTLIDQVILIHTNEVI